MIVQQLDWETLDSSITPNDQFFVIKHYDEPVIDAAAWTLQIDGMVTNPLVLTLEDLQGAWSVLRGDLHDGMLGQHGVAVLRWRHRRCHLGRDAAFGRSWRKPVCWKAARK